MKLMTIPAAALAATFVFAQSAQAREHHRHHGLHRDASRHWSRTAYSDRQPREYRQREGGAGGFWSGSEVATYRGDLHSSLGGRPSAWCGWEMRQLVGSDPGPQFNLARNWARWGQAGPAGVGAIVVWAHHVGKIVGQEDGNWVIESGNDGHALRTRPRSIAGAIAIRWG